jgi:hypothetical protein
MFRAGTIFQQHQLYRQPKMATEEQIRVQREAVARSSNFDETLLKNFLKATEASAIAANQRCLSRSEQQSSAKNFDRYAAAFSSVDKNILQRAVSELWSEMTDVLEVSITIPTSELVLDSMRQLERISVILLGHRLPQIRNHGVRLLNVLYDGVPWQKDVAFTPEVCCTGANFSVEIWVRHSLSEDGSFIFQVAAPSFAASGATEAEDCGGFSIGGESEDEGGDENTEDDIHPVIITAHPAVVLSSRGEGAEVETLLRLDLAPFPCCGFYDWRVLELSSEGPGLLPVMRGKDDIPAHGRSVMLFCFCPWLIFESQVYCPSVLVT